MEFLATQKYTHTQNFKIATCWGVSRLCTETRTGKANSITLWWEPTTKGSPVGSSHLQGMISTKTAMQFHFSYPRCYHKRPAPVYLIQSVHAMNWAKMEDNASMVALGKPNKITPLGGWGGWWLAVLVLLLEWYLCISYDFCRVRWLVLI